MYFVVNKLLHNYIAMEALFGYIKENDWNCFNINCGPLSEQKSVRHSSSTEQLCKSSIMWIVVVVCNIGKFLSRLLITHYVSQQYMLWYMANHSACAFTMITLVPLIYWKNNTAWYMTSLQYCRYVLCLIHDEHCVAE